MTRNVKVTRAYGQHKGGTKDYTIFLIEGPDGSLLVRNFGPIGAANGNAKIDLVRSDADFHDALHERRSKGYSMDTQAPQTMQPHELSLILKDKLLKTMEQRHVRWLCKGWELDTIPGAGGNVVAERDKLRAQMERDAAALKAQQTQVQQLDKDAQFRELAANNPLFGMF